MDKSRHSFDHHTGAPSAVAPITEEMIVEHVVRVYPDTKDVFTLFQVDGKAQGGWTLRQLGRSHGLDVDALVLALNQSLGRRGGPVPVPELLWDSSCDGMMLIDAGRRVLALNPTLERWIGHSTHEVVGRSECGALFACQDRRGDLLWDHAERCPGLRAIRRFKAVTAAEYTIRTARGERIPASASYTPIQPRPGGPVWALVVMRDARLQQRREQRLLRQAATDPLTGLPNRAPFLAACSRELALASRHDRPLAIAIADLDGFKRYNDAHGHPAGDELLKALAEVLRTGLRTSEMVARYGGDEFVLLLPETDANGAMILARRLGRMVEQFPFARVQGNGHPPLTGRPATFAQDDEPITLTIGVAVFPGDGKTAEALLATADRRLYDAKQQGRNRIVGPLLHTVERRCRRRIALEAPVLLLGLGERPEDALWQEGRTKNVSLAGALCAMPQWKPVAVGETMMLSIAIPPERQQGFPFSRLAGRGRVVRVEELGRPGGSSRKRLELALAFGSDLIALAVAPGAGVAPERA